MVVSLLFTVTWGVIFGTAVEECCYTVSDNMWLSVWISVIVLGSLAFLGTSGCYIRNRLRSKQETQAIEFNTNTIELATVSSGVHNTIDPTQNKLAEEDLDKEIALFEKRKKLAQLKNEVINLETVEVRASTSESLGQVISVNRGY